MLRGNSPAKVDDKGRIKIPTVFRKFIEEKYGRECFLTSLSGEFVRVYPMPVWLGIEKRIAKLPSNKPAALKRFLNHVNYFGQVTAMDDQGRILVPPRLRTSSDINGDVAVLGYLNYLDIWNREKFEAVLKAGPVSDDDQQVLSSLGI
jgi:transcriptional regulator MraZ